MLPCFYRPTWTPSPISCWEPWPQIWRWWSKDRIPVTAHSITNPSSESWRSQTNGNGAIRATSSTKSSGDAKSHPRQQLAILSITNKTGDISLHCRLFSLTHFGLIKIGWPSIQFWIMCFILGKQRFTILWHYISEISENDRQYWRGDVNEIQS